MPAESLIWRRLFKDTYDIPRQRSSTELKIEYQTRSIVLAQKISFKCGEGEEQTLWLEVLRDMLLESFESKNPSTSKNIKRIRSAHSTTEFLDRPLNGYSQHKPGPPSELLCAVQLVSHRDNKLHGRRLTVVYSASLEWLWISPCFAVVSGPTMILELFTRMMSIRRAHWLTRRR